MAFQPLVRAPMQSLQREYSSDKVPQWLNRKVITCANKLWPVVAFGGSKRGDRAVGKHDVRFVSGFV
jgi:hypothetical protein